MRLASRQPPARLAYPESAVLRCTHRTELALEFFEKYRLQNVGATRSRLAELITIFENERHELTIRELHDLREEMDRLTARLRAGQTD